MSVSGDSSSSSVFQEKYISLKMHKTPATPMKIGWQVTPMKSASKRSLFQSNSPSKSDDLGLMSPLSFSSSSLENSFDSPQFSPNGKFSTPPRTPNQEEFQIRSSPRLASKKIKVKSSLFPDLKLHSPKSRNTQRTSGSLILKMLTPQSNLESLDDIESGVRSLRSPNFRNSIFSSMESFVAESDSSPDVGLKKSKGKEIYSDREDDKPTKLGIKPLSCESFYGAQPKSVPTKGGLFIDSLEPRGRKLIRSFSKESLLSNKSFVSGGTHKKPKSSSHRSKSCNGNRRKAPHIGVWHNIKKPKQIKKIHKPEKPMISPQSRIAKMLRSPNSKEIKIKSKPLLVDNPRKRISKPKKRTRNEAINNCIIDSFPDHLIKRRKLPTSSCDLHPATLESAPPDPNKKFLKYGQTRTATFTLNDNVKLQISDGVIKLKSPKKRRKLYSGKKDVIEDFNDFEERDNALQQNIQHILNQLQNSKEITPDHNAEKENVSTDNVFKSLDTNSGKLSPSKDKRSRLKTVTNLPDLIYNDFDSDENEENIPAVTDTKKTDDKKSNETALATTGNMVSYLTNILINKDVDVGKSPRKEDSREEEMENSPPDEDKYYSLFYKQNWNKSSTLKGQNTLPLSGSQTKNPSHKKKVLVPDDQYLLDAGQKSIGIVTCKKCGVMYQSGDFADEAIHNNFHNHLPELRFNGWTNERVVGRYPDGRIIMILNADPKAWWQKVSKIVDIVDQDLGFPEASVNSLFYKTVYLYINEKAKQIVGCLIAEECKVAYRMFPPFEGVQIDSCSRDPSPCKVGISRIWTALSHRRKGVASRMIDCLQRTFFFGDIVPLEQLAFSVPSPAGKLLAQKVTGRLDFLVYGFF